MTRVEFDKTALAKYGCAHCGTPVEPEDTFTWYGDVDGNGYCSSCN